jgi:lipid-A-disaccharide synthase
VEYRGNPLVDETERKISSMPDRNTIRKSLNLSEKPVIALMAGSRSHEVESILPQMLKVISHFPDHQFVLAGVKNLPDELYRKIIGEKPVICIKDRTYEILHISKAALIASGTATLEAALFEIPQVVCYKGDFFSMLTAWIVIKVKYVSLVNLIMNSEVVKELLGYSLNGRNLTQELRNILPGGEKREEILTDYRILKEKLGPAGASGRIAREMVKELRG